VGGAAGSDDGAAGVSGTVGGAAGSDVGAAGVSGTVGDAAGSDDGAVVGMTGGVVGAGPDTDVRGIVGVEEAGGAVGGGVVGGGVGPGSG